MATLTAQILVGQSHPNHGGIIPTHQLFLSENSRPAWLLNEIDSGKTIARWIPTLEHMLEDGIVMILRHVPNVQATDLTAADLPTDLELYEISDSKRQRMYDGLRSCQIGCKLILTVFSGSSLEQHLRVLKEISVAVEVCTGVFKREHSPWAKNDERNLDRSERGVS
jgi:hypothetical protein